MDDCITFPVTYKDSPSLSSFNPIFSVAPITVKTISDRRISYYHWHDYLQLWYTVSGSYLHTVNGVTYPQHPGSLMLIFPYTKHSIDSSVSNLSETTVIEISIKKAFLENNMIPFLPNTYSNGFFDSVYLPHSFSFLEKEKRIVDSICLDLLEEYNKHGQMHITQMLNLVTQLLTVCVNDSCNTISNYEMNVIKNRTDCIDKSMSFIVDNFTKNISLNDISKFATMSRSTFTTSFYSTVGQTCHSYITKLKISRALKLLRQPDKSISEVAQECGFYDANYMAKVLKRQLNISPRELRK